jgi:hypothetical protein
MCPRCDPVWSFVRLMRTKGQPDDITLSQARQTVAYQKARMHVTGGALSILSCPHCAAYSWLNLNGGAWHKPNIFPLRRRVAVGA